MSFYGQIINSLDRYWTKIVGSFRNNEVAVEADKAGGPQELKLELVGDENIPGSIILKANDTAIAEHLIPVLSYDESTGLMKYEVIRPETTTNEEEK